MSSPGATSASTVGRMDEWNNGPRPPPAPPPIPGLVFLRGIAREIRIGLEPHGTAFISTSALSLSPSSPNRTKPNPLLRPVDGSVTTRAFRTRAQCLHIRYIHAHALVCAASRVLIACSFDSIRALSNYLKRRGGAGRRRCYN